jgi:hypothetical protein
MNAATDSTRRGLGATKHICLEMLDTLDTADQLALAIQLACASEEHFQVVDALVTTIRQHNDTLRGFLEDVVNVVGAAS